LAITNQFQIYENVRLAVIRLFDVGDRYDVTDLTKIKMNNAYELAQKGSITSEETEHSMWFIPGKKSYEELNENQLWMMNLYAQI
jgi:hypothetical protein